MRFNSRLKYLMLAGALLLTALVYWPGLSGNFLFDDYPNIVDNQGVQPKNASLTALASAALSSPSSEFKRPLSSLSFAANYLATGLDPYWMKLTNLTIHLLNGLLIFLLTRYLLLLTRLPSSSENRRIDVVAALVTTGWLLQPINLTAVLYVVQRMESLANIFVLLGLIGYVVGRRRMLTPPHISAPAGATHGWGGFWLCAASVTLPTAIGVLAKETAVMLPLYALLVEWLLLGFRKEITVQSVSRRGNPDKLKRPAEMRLAILFLLALALPFIVGASWLLSKMLQPENWSTRDFTLGTRLLSETRVVVDYIIWTLLPTPEALSFYHDDFHLSTGLLAPWTTLACLAVLTGLVALIWWLRSRRPLTALGIALFLACQLLTGTIVPLELIYEHRNYFASFGLLLAIVPLLAAGSNRSARATSIAIQHDQAAISTSTETILATNVEYPHDTLPMAAPRYILLAGMMLCWTTLTALTAYAWGNPLRLAEDLAARAPRSHRAQYELGRTYIIYSHYDPDSPFTQLAYAPLERSAAIPDSSILPEQALIFMNSRMHLPVKDAWWESLIAKLKSHAPTIQDESSLASLTHCAIEHQCDLPHSRMVEAFEAATTHPHSSARLLANYGDYAWNILNDKPLGLRLTGMAVQTSPGEPEYRITLIRMMLAQGQMDEAREAFKQVQSMNFGGRLNAQLAELRTLPGMQ